MTAAHPKEAALLSHYDNKMKYYSPASEPDRSVIMKAAGAPTTGDMLDVGCGDGRASGWSHEHGMGYVGIDYSSKRIEHAKKIQAKKGHRGLVLAHGDLYEALPQLNAGGFTLIWCCELLEHLEEPAVIWDEMRRLVAPGGMILCTCPVDMPYSAHLQVWKEDEEISDLFAPSRLWHHETKTRDHFVFVWDEPE